MGGPQWAVARHLALKSADTPHRTGVRCNGKDMRLGRLAAQKEAPTRARITMTVATVDGRKVRPDGGPPCGRVPAVV